MVEVQALTNRVAGDFPPKHKCSGVELDRLHLLLAGMRILGALFRNVKDDDNE